MKGSESTSSTASMMTREVAGLEAPIIIIIVFQSTISIYSNFGDLFRRRSFGEYLKINER